jgi:hypothetical protein
MSREGNAMKVFDRHHIDKGWASYADHWLRASKLSVGLLGASVISLIHACIPFFLTDFISLYVKKLHHDLNLCKCKK